MHRIKQNEVNETDLRWKGANVPEYRFLHRHLQIMIGNRVLHLLCVGCILAAAVLIAANASTVTYAGAAVKPCYEHLLSFPL
jgi:hypothetical protein